MASNQASNQFLQTNRQCHSGYNHEILLLCLGLSCCTIQFKTSFSCHTDVLTFVSRRDTEELIVDSITARYQDTVAPNQGHQTPCIYTVNLNLSEILDFFLKLLLVIHQYHLKKWLANKA